MKSLMLLLLLIGHGYARSQGCVAVRSITGIETHLLPERVSTGDKWLLNFTNRYFEGSDTYRGKEYITDTLVRNKLYTFNITAERLLPKGWSLAVQVPISANYRRNTKDHGGSPNTPKHTTRAFGLGDMRLTAYKWLWDLSENRKTNLQAGLGLKLPTGDYRYQDYFYRNDTTKVLAPVDQAIQLGDGGTGITAELTAFYTLNKTVTAFVSGFYLANPREQNGVSSLKGVPPTALDIKSGGVEMSVPDQYSLRGGADIQFRSLVLTAALRYERVPAEDLIGGSNGFRRAAAFASVEPGIMYRMKKLTTFAFATVPFERRLLQSVPDKRVSALTGNYTITQAGLTAFIVYAGASLKL